MASYYGIAFPFNKDASSFPQQATDNELIRQSIIQILLTARGERVMRPDFGSGIYGLIFENNNAALAELLRLEVANSIGKFEPRVVIQSIDVTNKDTTVTVTINYVVLSTRTQDVVQVALSTGGP